jgi:hypothetical protein
LPALGVALLVCSSAVDLLPARASFLAAWFAFLPSGRCCDWLVAKAAPDSAKSSAAASIAPIQSPFLESNIFSLLSAYIETAVGCRRSWSLSDPMLSANAWAKEGA